jgi:hypothetical protein
MQPELRGPYGGRPARQGCAGARSLRILRDIPRRRGRKLGCLAIAAKVRDVRPSARQQGLGRSARDEDWPNPRAPKARAKAANFVYLVNCHCNSLESKAKEILAALTVEEKRRPAVTRM